MKASDLFVRCLENEGVTHVFGLPGEENADFVLSLERSSIEFVLCRHEQAAAFMADAYGRLTGRAGVCMGTLGPGAANLVTGVADANMDRAPMVVITAQADTRRMHKESHQAMDVVGMFEPITKWARQVIHPGNIPEVVRKAFKLAQDEKPGACLIELPEDIAAMETGGSPIPAGRVRRPTPDDEAVARAVELLRGARRPIVLAGNGVVRKRASEPLLALSRRAGLPVVNTFMGKGAIPWTDEHCLFTVGLQARDVVLCEIERSDAVFAVGYDLVEYPPRLWNTGVEKRIVHVDFEPAEVDGDYRTDVEIVGDVASSLRVLRDALGDGPPLFDIGERSGVRDHMLADFREFAEDDSEGTIKPQKVLADVRAALGPDDVLLSDVGAHKMWIARHYQCERPNTCLISNGFCSMGFALPGALATAMVRPGRRVLAICGDGGVLMNIQDLETAVRLRLDVVIMIWEDGGYGLIEWKQQTHFGDHTDLAFGNPDWVRLAEAFSAGGLRVENARDLAPALEEAFAQQGPTLLAVPIDYSQNLALTERLGDIACPI